MAARSGAKKYLGFMVIPLLVVMVASVVTLVAGHPGIAAMIGNLGVLLTVAVTLIYIVFFDSKRRWPGSSASQRLMKVMTFTR